MFHQKTTYVIYPLFFIPHDIYMSNQVKGPICRQTYFNQGSYLRARDNEKQICNVITEIENGTIIPYIVSHGGEIDGNLTVKGNLTVTGNLNVNGNLSYAGNISLGNSCSDIITVGGTSTFTCPATFSDVDINGGTIDGTTIGGTAAGIGTFTTLTAGILAVTSGASIPDLGSSAPGTGTFKDLTIKQSGPAADQSTLIIQSDAAAAIVPSISGTFGGTATLLGRSSNTCGTILYTDLDNAQTIILLFAAAVPVTPIVQITIQGGGGSNEFVHLTGVTSSTSFTVTNSGPALHSGTIHYFVVDMGV